MITPVLRNRVARLLCRLLTALAAVSGAAALSAQSYTFTTIAGLAGRNGSEDGPRGALFSAPNGIARDATGAFYVADADNHTVRKITSAGVVTTLAGRAGSSGSVDGIGSDARFNNPRGVAVDSAGNVYVADAGSHTIRKITSAGVVTTVAGLAGSTGSTDGTGSTARFNGPTGVAVDTAGTIYVADAFNATIRTITSSGTVATLAGLAGSTGSTDATGSVARFNGPTGVAVDATGNIYVADAGNSTIRHVTGGGAVTTFAGSAGSTGTTNGTGSAARFNNPRGVAVDSAGVVFVADTGNHTIRRISTGGSVSKLVGNPGNSGAVDSNDANETRFNFPRGVVVDANGGVFVADTGNHTVRRYNGGDTTTFAGTAGVAGAADGAGRGSRFRNPQGTAVDAAGNVYVADTDNDTIRKITSSGVTSTLAGTAGNDSGTLLNGTGSAARFFRPRAVAVDAAGTVYVADTGNLAIRKVTDTGVVTTLAGGPGGGAAGFSALSGVAVDGSGNVYVTDSSNHTVKRVTSGGSVSILAGAANSIGSADGTGGDARFNAPSGVAVDSTGNVYVADGGNRTIRKITSAGVVTTLAGSAGTTGSTDGTGTAARFSSLGGLAVDSAGHLTVADNGNQTIRRITSAGVVTTVAGQTGSAGAIDGTGTAARFNGPVGVAVDSAGNLFVADTNNQTIRAGAPGLPVMTSPTAATIAVGANFTYTATFSGVLAGPFSVNGLPGGLSFNSSTGVISGSPTTAGTSNVTLGATNGAGTGFGTLTLTIGAAQTAPAITTQPTGQVASAGTNVTFSVVATGTPAPTYQWRKDGTAIAGATASSLTLTAVTASDTAGYTVVVTNSAGTVTSTAAILAVTPAATAAPTISVQPAAQVATAGASVTLSVVATGNPTPTYQWRKDGTAIAGATASSLTLTAVTAGDTASYTVVVTNSAGTVTSAAAILAVTGTANSAPVITAQPASQAVAAGRAVTVSVTATGNPAPTYQWRKDGAALPGATNSSLTLNSFSFFNVGGYSVVVSNSAGSVTSATARVTLDGQVEPGPAVAYLSNLSVLARAGSGSETLTAGVTVGGGDGPKSILFRGVGPTLAGFGVGNALVDPILSISRDSTRISQNDDWGNGAALVTAAGTVGAFALPANSKDAVILGNGFTRGGYVVALEGKEGATGTALIEIYDADRTGVVTATSPRLTNIAARTFGGTGSDTLIVGFTVAGTGTLRVLVRASGPALVPFGLTGLMPDPKVELYDGAGAKLAENDNWEAATLPLQNSVGAFPFLASSRDSVLVMTLSPGGYTAQVVPVGAPGVALIEVYVLP